MHSSGGKDGVTADFQLQTLSLGSISAAGGGQPCLLVLSCFSEGVCVVLECPLKQMLGFKKKPILCPWDSRLSPRPEEKANMNEPW